MKDQIEKSIELKTPSSKVWQALINYREFGEWFQVKLGGPFVPGQILKGQITYPGYENYSLELNVQKMEPEHLFSFTWHPYAIDTNKDYSKETPTLVKFNLKPIKSGTLLIVTESGFDKIPNDRRAIAFQKNDEGWAEQMKNIKRYLEN